MLTIKPSKTIKPTLEKGEEVQFAIDVTAELKNADELSTMTVASVDYNIFDADEESVNDDFNGGVSEAAGIITFGIVAHEVGKYKLEFIVTCHETLPTASIPYEFIFYMWVKVKDI